MSLKLKYLIVVSTIFIIGLLAGLFLANIHEKSKTSESSQLELVHTVLWVLIPKDAKEIEMLTQAIKIMPERKIQDTKSFICKLVELKVKGLEDTREKFIGTTIFKDNPSKDPIYDFYNKYIDEAKLSSVRAGCHSQ